MNVKRRDPNTAGPFFREMGPVDFVFDDMKGRKEMLSRVT